MSQKAQAAVAEARKHILGYNIDPGYNRNSPNRFDCSSFVQYCYRMVGIDLPRTTYDQIKCGKAVSQNNLKVGDLVFPNIGLVGLYTGNGKMIYIDNKRDVIKESNIWAFYTARRVA